MKYFPPTALLMVLGVAPVLAQAPPPPAAPPPPHVDFYRSNINHTGVSAETMPAAPLSLLWRHTEKAAPKNPASPVTANGVVYFAAGGFIYAVSAADGTTRWQYPSGDKPTTFFATTPALDSGFLYVTDDNGQAYKLDAASGKELWKAKLDGALRSAPVVSGGVVYFGSGNNHCYAVNAANGQTLWDTPTDGVVSASPIITGGLVTFSSADGNVYGFNARTGRKAWSTLFDTDPSIVPLVSDGTNIFATAGDTITLLNPSSGRKGQTIKLGTTVLTAPTVSVDSIYVITQNSVLYALSSAGKTRWRATLDSGATAPPLLAGSMLLVPTQEGVLSGYDAASGKLVWRYVLPASATDSQPKAASTEVYDPPILAGGTVYVVSDDGSLSAFRADAPDGVGPRLIDLVPNKDATLSDNAVTVYGALLIDDGTGINPSSVSLELDGKAVEAAQYFAGQNALYTSLTEPLKEGDHKVTVKAADWKGNALNQSWSFKIDNNSGGRNRGGRNGGGGNYPGYNPYAPNYPGRGGRSRTAPPPPPPIVPF